MTPFEHTDVERLLDEPEVVARFGCARPEVAKWEQANREHPDNLQIFVGRSKVNRKANAEGPRTTASAIQGGIMYLRRCQSVDGSWRYSSDSDRVVHATADVRKESPIAATALAIYAMLGADGLRDDSPLRKPIEKGLMFIGSEIKIDGDAADMRGADGDMTSHGLAATVFCEAFAMTKDERLRTPAEAAIRFIEESQHEDGGWGRQPRTPGDLLTTAWQCIAIDAARDAHLSLPDDTIARAEQFLAKHQAIANRDSGSKNSKVAPAELPACLLARLLLDPGLMTSDLNFADLVKTSLRNGPIDDDVTCNFFSAMLGSCDPGHRDFSRWVKSSLRQSPNVVRTELECSWFSPHDTQADSGRQYQTAMNLLILESYYGFLAVCDRAEH